MLGYIISQKGIKMDSDKTKAIRKILVPKTENEIRRFLGKLHFISKFIAKLIIIYKPIFNLLRKDQIVIWNE